MKIKSAIISVSNKDGLQVILRELQKYSIKLISSGGTYKKIRSLGYKCTEVSNFTNFPEIVNIFILTLKGPELLWLNQNSV